MKVECENTALEINLREKPVKDKTFVTFLKFSLKIFKRAFFLKTKQESFYFLIV